MSESAASKEVAVENTGMPDMASGDVEMGGDKGIITHAAPLVRELKSRHLQMIAIGMICCLFPAREPYI